MIFAEKIFSDIHTEDIIQNIKNNKKVDAYFILVDSQSKNIMEIVPSRFNKDSEKMLIGVSKNKKSAYALVAEIIAYYLPDVADSRDLKQVLGTVKKEA